MPALLNDVSLTKRAVLFVDAALAQIIPGVAGAEVTVSPVMMSTGITTCFQEGNAIGYSAS